MMMNQCLLGRGDDRQTAWIDDRGAFPGARVEIKPGNEFWEVIEVYETKLPREVVAENERNWKQHRNATDI